MNASVIDLMSRIVGIRRFPLAEVLVIFAAVVSPTAAAQGDDVLASINGHEVRRSYVYEQIEALPLGEQISIRAQFDRFVQSIVREEILFQFVIGNDFTDDPKLREAIKTTVVNHLIERHVTDKVAVTETDILAYYSDNASAIRDENIRASQILLKQRKDCTQLMQHIDSDAAFAAAARERSLHQPSAQANGDIGLFMNHDGPLGFESEFFTMKVGEMRVFDSDDGCHLVRIMARVTPPMPPLEAVAPRIRELIEQQRRTDLLRALLERAAAEVDVKWVSPVAKP